MKKWVLFGSSMLFSLGLMQAGCSGNGSKAPTSAGPSAGTSAGGTSTGGTSNHGGVSGTSNTAVGGSTFAGSAATGGRYGRQRWRSIGQLHLEAGATLLFSQQTSEYLPAVLTRWEGLDVMNWSPFIYARDAHDVAITGPGGADLSATRLKRIEP